VNESTRHGTRRFMVRLPAAGGGKPAKPGFPVWDKSLRRVRKRYPRAVSIWPVTPDRAGFPPWLGQAGRVIRRTAGRAWRWTRSRDAKPW
jgi:hypothetical protein